MDCNSRNLFPSLQILIFCNIRDYPTQSVLQQLLRKPEVNNLFAYLYNMIVITIIMVMTIMIITTRCLASCSTTCSTASA